MGFDSFGNDRVDRDQLKILQFIATKKCTYKAEIAKHVGMRNQKVGNILNELHDAELIERIFPGQHESLDDARLLDRRSDIWMHGKRGNNRKNSGFRKPNFYGLNTELNWVLKVDGKNIYLDEYHDRVFQEPEKSTIELLKEKTPDEAYI